MRPFPRQAMNGEAAVFVFALVDVAMTSTPRAVIPLLTYSSTTWECAQWKERPSRASIVWRMVSGTGTDLLAR